MSFSFEIKLPFTIKELEDWDIQDQVAHAFYNFEALLVGDMEKSVQSWWTKPDYHVWYDLDGDSIDIHVLVYDIRGVPVWTYLDQGVEPHVIEPTNYSFLRFRALETGGRFSRSYVAKTGPGYLIAREGGHIPGARFLRFSDPVFHPGVDSRNFSSKIYRRRKKHFELFMREAALGGPLQTRSIGAYRRAKARRQKRGRGRRRSNDPIKYLR